MVKLIMGLKGSGKTKALVDLVKKAVDMENGAVICIEKDKDLTYDIPYTVRLVQAAEYGICNNDLFRGFISGLYAGNYDITHVFIDNFFKILSDSSDVAVEGILEWLDEFSKKNNVNFTISATKDPATVSDKIKSFIG